MMIDDEELLVAVLLHEIDKRFCLFNERRRREHHIHKEHKIGIFDFCYVGKPRPRLVILSSGGIDNYINLERFHP